MNLNATTNQAPPRIFYKVCPSS
jgi:hypothetical protein